jgi:hypothetical protein
MKFRTTLLQSGKTAVGIQVPNEVVDVDIELDTQPRELALPDDFSAAQ